MSKFISTLILVGMISSSVFGKPSQIGKIQGGEPAAPGEFPFTVSIRSNRWGHTCGGAILSPTLVVTAALCANTIPPPQGASPKVPDTIVAGNLHVRDDSPSQQVRVPGRIVHHPEYELYFPHNDISLIFLDEPFEFNENVSAVALPAAGTLTYPDPVVLTGWGNEQYGLNLSDVLLKVTLDTFSDEYCGTFLGEMVEEQLLCSGSIEGGSGGCAGDAGSPLVSAGENVHLVAVESHFGCPTPDCCGTPGPTGHGPEVAYYLDWIAETSAKYGGGLNF